MLRQGRPYKQSAVGGSDNRYPASTRILQVDQRFYSRNEVIEYIHGQDYSSLSQLSYTLAPRDLLVQTNDS